LNLWPMVAMLAGLMTDAADAVGVWPTV
jgi:hypothetical protein